MFVEFGRTLVAKARGKSPLCNLHHVCMCVCVCGGGGGGGGDRCHCVY